MEISKKAKKLIEDFELDCNDVFYERDRGISPKRLEIVEKNYTHSSIKLYDYIAKLENKVREYKKAITSNSVS